ncbi:chaperonin 10-like protein [Aspergillus unguis]
MSTMECLVQSSTGQPVVASRPRPQIENPHQVLVQITAVALNPTDFKSPMFNPLPGATMGCDFVGIVVATGEAASHDLPSGTRVCSARHGNNPGRPDLGAFAQYVIIDSRLLLRVPATWTDVDAAALGGVGWGSAALTIEQSLKLTGRPSKPASAQADGSRTPVLVYGAATATGTMACQLLSLSGYKPIATATSLASRLKDEYRAAVVVPYTSPTCAETIRSQHTGGHGVRHALDCICTPESVSVCFEALARVGARYACLDYVPPESRPRKSVKVDMPLAYTLHGSGVQLPEPYRRDPDPSMLEFTRRWRDELQPLLDEEILKPHPPRELQRGWNGVIEGLEMLKRGEVRGQKLVVVL